MVVQKIVFGIENLHCEGCVSSVQNALLGVSGVRSALIDLPSKKATVEFDSARCSKAELAKAVNETGKTAVL